MIIELFFLVYFSVFINYQLPLSILVCIPLQLQGGIHRYLQAYPDGGKFEGKNFVFDSRIAMGPDGETASTATKVVGHCIDCNSDFDRYSGNIVCTVCRQPVLVCDHCVENNPYPNEYYCVRHRYVILVLFVIRCSLFLTIHDILIQRFERYLFDHFGE